MESSPESYGTEEDASFMGVGLRLIISMKFGLDRRPLPLLGGYIAFGIFICTHIIYIYII